MINLFDPDNIEKRRITLEELKVEIETFDIKVKPISKDDLHCFWVTLDCDKEISMCRDLWEDVKHLPDVMEMLKNMVQEHGAQ